MPGLLLRAVFGLYASLAFLVIVLLLLCPVLIAAPILPLRRTIGRWAVRAWLLSIGVRFQVQGRQNLPSGPCVVVCNHASYVDGIVLTAALPSRFSFLVQHRARSWPYVGLVIRRMGVRFVNRESPRQAACAVLGLIRGARRGDSFAIFPEGTFRRAPGLQPFHTGAFLVGAKAGVPIVPVAMRGTRTLLADGAPWPSWSSVEIEILTPLESRETHRAAARDMQDLAHRQIEQHCGEAGASGTGRSP